MKFFDHRCSTPRFTSSKEPRPGGLLCGTCVFLTVFAYIGPYDFSGHAEIQQNLLLNTECHRIDCNLTEILFLGEQGTSTWGEHSRGVANVWDHPYVTSQTLPPPSQNNSSMSEWQPETAAKSAKKL